MSGHSKFSNIKHKKEKADSAKGRIFTRLGRESAVCVKLDGLARTLPAGAIVEIERGCSITLHPGLYHRFWAKKGAGDPVLGEVSSINDDHADNVFWEAGHRFSAVEEDEPALAPLCNEYHLL